PCMLARTAASPLFPYTALFRSGDVPSRRELQVLVGVAHHLLAARVHHDDLGAALGRVLQEGGGHRVVLSRPRADDDHAVAVLGRDRMSTRLNSSHVKISYAGFC